MHTHRLVGRSVRAAAAIAVAFLAGSCLSATDNPRREPPILRFANATPESFIGVFFDELPDPMTLMSSNTVANGCFLVLPENHLISFIQNADTLFEFEASLQRDAEYAVVIVGDGTTYRGVSVLSDQVVDDGSIGVTLINASSSAGDVYITGATDDPAPATRVASNLTPALTATDAPPHVTAPTSSLRIRLFDVGSTTDARADLTLDPAFAGRSYTVIFTEGSFPAAGGLLVQPCDPVLD
jgi:hypothetical protein